MSNDSIIELNCYCGETYFAGEQHLGKYINCSCGQMFKVARPSEIYKSDFYPNTDFRTKDAAEKKPSSSLTLAGVVIGILCLYAVSQALLGYFQSPEQTNAPSSLVSSGTPYPQATAQPTPDLSYNVNSNRTIEVPPDFLEDYKPISLKNGANITSPQGPRGRAYLRIINDFDTDVAVKLVENTTGKTRRFFYVRANSRATVKGIAAEDCRLFFSTGEDWDTENRKFLRNAAYTEVDTVFSFKRNSQILSIKPSVNGTIFTEPIDEEKFADK